MTPPGSLFCGGARLYCLALHNARKRTREVGALGAVTWPAGWTYYAGRAHHGWPSRVARFGGDFTPHWHVDYLLCDDPRRLRGVLPVDRPGTEECRLVRFLAGRKASEPLAPGFGASDCTEGCDSHAWVSAGEPGWVFPRLIEEVPGTSGWVRCREDAWDWVVPAGDG